MIKLKQFPSFIEVIGVWILTMAASLAAAKIVEPFAAYGVIVSYSSHIPQFVLPLIWFHYRVKPSLTGEKVRLFQWKKRSTKLFLIMAVILAALNLLDELVQGRGMAQPPWVKNGAGSIVLTLIFQGVFVGFAEEMMVRAAFHLPLKLKWGNKSRVPWAYLLTAFAFGLFHLSNYFLGQPLGPTLVQAASAVVLGLIFGFFYEKTENYVGTALLHNLFDLAGAIGVLIVTW